MELDGRSKDMVTLGADTHKASHTVVAVDEVGRQVGEKTVAATPAGHRDLLAWAGQFPERRFALEDVRHLSRRLEQDLLVAGERVLRVPTRLMGEARRSGRERGKSDPIDALATARAALRHPELPEAFLEGVERELRLLVDHREDYVAERTRLENRLLWDLHELVPGHQVAPRSLGRLRTLDSLAHLLAPLPGLVADIARERLERIRALTLRINELEHEIERRTTSLAPTLLDLQGCGALTAAKVVGETAKVSRFSSRAAFALANGTAPIPVSSGRRDRFRLNRGGNRQLNCALHRIAITQMRLGGPGKAYIERRLAAGNTKTEAIRALRRRISDEVFRRLLIDHGALTEAASPCALAAA
jgi:transposase